MPGTNLTREEAQTRAALLTVESYDIALDLTVSDKVFESTTVIRFACSEAGASTFADLVGANLHSVTLNGRDLDGSEVYRDHRIRLEGLADSNELRVHCELPYSHTGEGLHRFVDPADGRVYLYTQFEVPDARRVYTTFEQPDLKAVFRFAVTAPQDWKVVSNTSPGAPEPAGEASARWTFPPTKPMSTYITALVAGEYAEVRDTYRGKHGDIELGHYCRQSRLADFDTDELIELTKQGFAFFEDAFDYPYPFGKYDQCYVPEYNMGAMENAGCVTFRDDYIPRSRQTPAFYERRAVTVLHEMAHMWFGDLVTMRWWDDLWLNESFADWASHHAVSSATKYTDVWTGWTNSGKNKAYRQDQLPSTHPVAADNYDLEAVEVNFDGITYEKGAAALRQLVAWVGEDAFLGGLRRYFRAHEFGNTTFDDLLQNLEQASGRDLGPWAEEWLRTAGVSTLRPVFDEAADGTFSRFVIEQTSKPDFPTLRRHRIAIGLFDRQQGHLVRRESIETDVEGAQTAVQALVGKRRPDLLLVNDRDLTYAKIRLDDRSLRSVVDGIDTLEDSLARAVCWSAAWDMTRDAEMRPGDFVTLVLTGVASETDLTAVGTLLAYARTAAERYSAPTHRAELSARWEQGLCKLLESAESGSAHQLTFARALAASAHTESGLDVVEGLYRGTRMLAGLEVETDLRWLLLRSLAAAGRVEEADIEAELAQDNTISGRERAAAALTVIPTADAKERAWQDAVVRDDTANETQRQITVAFQAARQEDLLTPYVERYLAAAGSIWEQKGVQRSRMVLEWMFPSAVTTEQTLAAVDAWLSDSSANPAALRYVREGRDDLARALAAQAADT